MQYPLNPNEQTSEPRQKRNIFSIGIIIAIPVLLIVNTIVLIQSTRRAFNNELMRKADVVNSVIAQTSLPLLKDKQYDILQKNIIALEQSNPSLLHSTVIVADGNTLKQVTQSKSASSELSARDSLEAKLAMERKLPIATLINTSDQKGKTAQAWNVMTPIIDESSNVIGAISVSMLTADAQEAIDAAYQTSFIILIVSILLIIGLLFRHFRLVGYAQLLARQKELNQTMSDFFVCCYP